MTVTSASPSILTTTITGGASLSDAQNVDGRLVAIETPAAWTAAGLTFQGSSDGATFADIWDAGLTATAAERTIASGNIPTSAARYLALSLNDWVGLKYVRLRSGTAAAPVAQGSARVIKLVLSG